MSETSRLEVGRVGRAHGLRGEVSVTLSSDRLERLAAGSVLYVDERALVVTAARPHSGRWLVCFEGVDDRTEAETLLGMVLTGDALPAAADELWVHELIGAAVRDRAGRDLGVVRAVEANPASDLLVLDGDVLVPITFVVEQGPGFVVVDPPEGLLDVNRRDWTAMRIDVITIFPEYLTGALEVSLLGRAHDLGLLDIRFHDPGEHAPDPHRSVDDAPFGGGAGMVMTPEPLFATVEAADVVRPLLLLSAAGRTFDQAMAHELAAGPGFSLICGRYEGVDQRVADHLCDGEVSIGDFVLAGGEAAALVMIEAVGRLVPGVLGNEDSVGDESFAQGLLEYPQYTRPSELRGLTVPEVLRSGDHARVARWRRAEALRRTLERRPELLAGAGGIGPEDRALLDEFPPERPAR